MSQKEKENFLIDPRQYRKTIRLTFQYEGENIRLIHRENVAMIAPGLVFPLPKKGESGFWYEVRDDRGRVLYSLAKFNPIRFEREVFPEDPKQSPHWVKIKKPAGIFELLVPDIPEATEVVLFSSPLKPEESGKPAEEIGKYPIRESSDKEREGAKK
jgi:hypothetical protein